MMNNNEMMNYVSFRAAEAAGKAGYDDICDTWWFTGDDGRHHLEKAGRGLTVNRPMNNTELMDMCSENERYVSAPALLTLHAWQLEHTDIICSVDRCVMPLDGRLYMCRFSYLHPHRNMRDEYAPVFGGTYTEALDNGIRFLIGVILMDRQEK
jgi:hypothetical protein